MRWEQWPILLISRRFGLFLQEMRDFQILRDHCNASHDRVLVDSGGELTALVARLWLSYGREVNI